MQFHRNPLAVCFGLGLGALMGSPASAQVAAFRMNDLDLRDPHVFVSVITCIDVTDSSVISFSVNSQLQTRIQNDDPSAPDGLLDLSNVFLFNPLNQSSGINGFDSGTADCTAPLAATSCNNFASSGLTGLATLATSGLCLAPAVGTTHGYPLGVTEASAPCFSSPVGTVMLDLGGIPVPLQDAQIAASFVGNPATGTVNGLMRGFLRESDADTVLIPAGIPFISGNPISYALPGGDPPGPGVNCAAHDDRDTHMGESGWWFYLNFTAPTVALATGSFTLGFGNGFED
jgi:hypothetical protein